MHGFFCALGSLSKRNRVPSGGNSRHVAWPIIDGVIVSIRLNMRIFRTIVIIGMHVTSLSFVNMALHLRLGVQSET